MIKQDKTIALAQWLRSVLAQGLPQTESVSEYIEATFGTTDLAAIIAEEATGEVDSLLELIFFPDMDLQIRYESHWGAESFSTSDLEKIQTNLCQAPLTAVIRAPGDAPDLPVEVPPFALEAFVQRLNITWQPVPQLINTLTTQWPVAAGTRTRVHLRNARLEWHTHQVELANHFLGKMPPDDADTETCLAFLLSILSEYDPNTAPIDFLIAKKFFYFQSLCKAEDFERKRQTSNMEIMMLQGNRACHGSVAQLRQQMQLIDRICQTLFGRTQFFQNPDEQYVDLKSGDDTQMMQDIMNKLS